MTKPVGGRPTKLNADMIDRICKLLQAGNFMTTVAELVGIDRGTLRRWLEKGQRSTRAGLEKELAERAKQAMAHAEVVALQRIVNARGTEWRAHAWYLERMYPERWRKKGRV